MDRRPPCLRKIYLKKPTTQARRLVIQKLLMTKPLLLCILDGFGLNPNNKANAVALAKKPNLDKLFQENPFTTLITHGERVGLPEGQMGNSEVGHLNIGAGRVIDQWLVKVSKGLKNDNDSSNITVKEFAKKINSQNTLHLLGLYSDGGVHSHFEHIQLLLKTARKVFSGKIALHLVTDGRDVAPNQSLQKIKECQEIIASDTNCFIATVGGRFFYMDRDKRWERINKAYDAVIGGKLSEKTYNNLSAVDYINASYEEKITDEFIEPNSFKDAQGTAYQGVKKGDGIIFCNFRDDRMREIVSALSIKEGATNKEIGFERSQEIFSVDKTLCLVEYDKTFNLPIIFDDKPISNHLGEVLSKNGVPQLRIAETEKYPHVTYFFNGGVETAYPLEERILIPSPREVKTYDEKPEMSAIGVKDAVIAGIKSGKYKFIVVNFANCDMVGHTAVESAVIKAVEVVDSCVGEILTALKESGWQAIFTADHGNAEQLIDYNTGAPHTSHTTYPVPLAIYGAEGVEKGSLREGGALCDIAPTVLALLGVKQPEEMTGEALKR